LDLTSKILTENEQSDIPHSAAGPAVLRVGIAIGILALTVRLALLWLTRSYLSPDPSEVVAIATALAKTGHFADAYGALTGPTAHASPLYPYLLSMVYRLFGTGVRGEIAQEILSCALASGVWALMPSIAVVCRIGKTVGVLAGTAGALLPINRAPETKGDFETAATGLMCALVFLTYVRCLRTHPPSAKGALLLGTISGVAILTSASLAAVICGLLALVPFVVDRRLGAIRLVFPITAALTILVVLSPWAIRNYLTLGSLVWTRSNFGIELNVSNNDLAVPNWGDNTVAMERYHPRANVTERRELMAYGEIKYNRQKRTQASQWISDHPRAFLGLTLRRVFYFWFPKMKRPIQVIAFAAITLGAFIGVTLLYGRDPILAITFIAMGITYPLVYYIVQASSRYVYPLQWMLVFLSSYFLWRTVRARRGSGLQA